MVTNLSSPVLGSTFFQSDMFLRWPFPRPFILLFLSANFAISTAAESDLAREWVLPLFGLSGESIGLLLCLLWLLFNTLSLSFSEDPFSWIFGTVLVSELPFCVCVMSLPSSWPTPPSFGMFVLPSISMVVVRLCDHDALLKLSVASQHCNTCTALNESINCIKYGSALLSWRKSGKVLQSLDRFEVDDSPNKEAWSVKFENVIILVICHRRILLKDTIKGNMEFHGSE